MLDGINAYEQGVGSIEDIDAAMIAGANHPMGPITLADFVGLDTLASIAGVMHDSYGEERFAAPATLTKLVDAGHYGRKSGRGYYDYSGEKPVAVDPGCLSRWCKRAATGVAALTPPESGTSGGSACRRPRPASP